METTLSGKSALERIKRTKDSGFCVEIYYIGLNSPNLNVKRVAQRVARGGHDIPKNLILKRYDESRRNLLESLKFADNVYIIDNSLDFGLNLVIKNGKILEIKNPLDEWVKDLKDEIEVKLKRT